MEDKCILAAAVTRASVGFRGQGLAHADGGQARAQSRAARISIGAWGGFGLSGPLLSKSCWEVELKS